MSARCLRRGKSFLDFRLEPEAHVGFGEKSGDLLDGFFQRVVAIVHEIDDLTIWSSHCSPLRRPAPACSPGPRSPRRGAPGSEIPATLWIELASSSRDGA